MEMPFPSGLVSRTRMSKSLELYFMVMMSPCVRVEKFLRACSRTCTWTLGWVKGPCKKKSLFEERLSPLPLWDRICLENPQTGAGSLQIYRGGGRCSWHVKSALARGAGSASSTGGCTRGPPRQWTPRHRHGCLLLLDRCWAQRAWGMRCWDWLYQ